MAELGEPISERELDVLNCLAEGASNREIADQLSISHNTVKVHLRNIYTKLGVSSRTEATTVALQQGVLTLPGIEVPEANEGEEESPAAETADGISPATDEAESVSIRQERPQDGVAALPPLPEHGAITQAPPSRIPRSIALYALAAVAVSALLLSALAVGRLWGNDRTEESTAPATEMDVNPADEFVETEIGNNWLAGRPLPSPRAHMAAVDVGLDIYLIGGETIEGVSNDVLVYSTQTRSWQQEEGASKLTAVADAAAAALAGEIYVVGGRLPSGQPTAVVEAYSPLNDGWRPVTPLPQPLVGAVALVQGGALYVLGGSDQEQVFDTAYVFDPATQTWQELPPMQQGRTFATGGVLQGDLYIVGGTDGEQALSTCELFDIARQEWLSCPDMAVPRAGAAAAVVLNKLYVIGGDREEDLAFSEVYDAKKENWEQVPTPMLEAEPDWPFLAVTNVETRVYALGGRHAEALSEEMYIYTPLVYQFFIPAAGRSD